MVTVIKVHFMVLVLDGEHKALMEGLEEIYGDTVFKDTFEDKAVFNRWIKAQLSQVPTPSITSIKELTADKVDTLMALIRTCATAEKDVGHDQIH